MSEVVPMKMGILVVDRNSMLRLALNGGVVPGRKPSVALPYQTVFHRYGGFDGEPWPKGPPPGLGLKDGLLEEKFLPQVLEFTAAERSTGSCAVVLLRAGTCAI